MGGTDSNSSVWHPLRGPCVDWPLAVCDASTVDFAKDTMASDFVDSWGYSENVQVHYSTKQKWYHLENQMPNELLVFKSADSEDGKNGTFPGTTLCSSQPDTMLTGKAHHMDHSIIQILPRQTSPDRVLKYDYLRPSDYFEKRRRVPHSLLTH